MNTYTEMINTLERTKLGHREKLETVWCGEKQSEHSHCLKTYPHNSLIGCEDKKGMDSCCLKTSISKGCNSLVILSLGVKTD